MTARFFHLRLLRLLYHISEDDIIYVIFSLCYIYIVIHKSFFFMFLLLFAVYESKLGLGNAIRMKILYKQKIGMCLT